MPQNAKSWGIPIQKRNPKNLKQKMNITLLPH